jgi:hypothetical protein
VLRRFVLLACAVSVALGCLVGVQLTAHADDGPPPEQQQPQSDPPPVPVPGGSPPKALLMKGNKELQKGRLGTYCWGGICADWLTFPDPGTTARVKAGSRLHVRIRYSQKPRHVQLWSAEKVNRRGWMVDARRKAISLKPVRREGRTVAWDASFSVKRPDRHYYLDFYGYWNGRDTEWGFHVKTRRES